MAKAGGRDTKVRRQIQPENIPRRIQDFIETIAVEHDPVAIRKPAFTGAVAAVGDAFRQVDVDGACGHRSSRK